MFLAGGVKRNGGARRETFYPRVKVASFAFSVTARELEIVVRTIHETKINC